ncbi:hypothetical protein [Cryptosporangium minutisporangium]|uniref:Uncharacterized protein n=1 Tax=Cryptosporangium minutisporangium TaxID=113569 RepID=A0ABP6SQS6_9ACTN
MAHKLWATAALTFLAGEALLRTYWLSGGRWGYTACDRTDLGDPSNGCGAAQVTSLPFWPGWGTLGVCVALAVLVGWALRHPGSPVAVGSVWAAAAALATAAFPLHLLFQIPAAATGRPSDWRDLLARLALVLGAAALAGLATTLSPPRRPRDSAYRPVAPWARRSAYVAVALPLLGWAVPHGLWVLDVPFGIAATELDDIRRNLSLEAAVAITAVPPLAGLLTLGLVQPWGQRFPRWVPALGDRAVPRLLALVPAGIVAVALVTYGALSVGVLVRSLADGSRTWSDLAEGWAVAATLLVFVGWGVALGATAVGYHRATRGAGAVSADSHTPAGLTAGRPA